MWTVCSPTGAFRHLRIPLNCIIYMASTGTTVWMMEGGFRGLFKGTIRSFVVEYEHELEETWQKPV
jgi:hypothetical protein